MMVRRPLRLPEQATLTGHHVSRGRCKIVLPGARGILAKAATGIVAISAEDTRIVLLHSIQVMWSKLVSYEFVLLGARQTTI
jgi:hypothetical protein